MNARDRERLESFQVVGIDYSTQAVDLVAIDYLDASDHSWLHVRLDGRGDGFYRAQQAFRAVRGAMTIWPNVRLVAIERPAGLNTWTSWLLGMVAGQTLAAFPRDTVVNYLSPSVWRPAFGISTKGGKAQVKARVRRRATQLGFDPGLSTPGDAYEAFALAWVMREENEKWAT